MRARTTPEDVDTSRILFYAGFAFLPWLWVINFIEYRPHLKYDDAPEDIKFYVKNSFYGFVAFMVLWGIWLSVYYSSLSSGQGWAQTMLLFQKGDTMFN
ncbi:hypothetical protein AAMO2058_000988600 [Amorphochlora amoebiformis]